MNRRWLLALLLGYSVAVGVTCVFPMGVSDTEWHSFYAYLDNHRAVPYVDVREGYPPLGFLAYAPLYYAFRDNVTAFSHCFRALNGAFLVATLFTFYLIMKEMHDEEKAWKLSLSYAVLPSVLIANTYSNDVVALLPAALAIYMMVKKKALPCGVLLGLATLGKGFPALLVIPALISFSDLKDRVKLLGSMLLVIVCTSLPFILLNPLTYLSTFTHVGSRGPWETVWAIGEGYYSHGGLLHPFFNKFFYHFNLLSVYPASHYDHAIYAWNLEQLPNVLTLLQVITVIAISLAYVKRKKDAGQLCGLLYIGYMLFFKGYSTQFAVSTPFYLLLATSAGMPLLFLAPLEISHMMQILSWNSQAFAPEFLRNWHLPILLSAVILRSIVFAVLTVTSFRSLGLRPVTIVVGRLISYLKVLKDRWLVLIASASIVMVLVSVLPLYGYVDGNWGFRSSKGTVSVAQSDWQRMEIDGLEKGEQIMVKLSSSAWFEAELANSTVQVEQGIRNSYTLKGSFNETMLFFRADAESCSLMLKMKHQRIPFKVTEGLEDDLSASVISEDKGLMFRLQDRGIDGNASRFTLAYPVSARVNDNFSLHIKNSMIEGNRSSVSVYVFDDTDEWLYPFAASEDFVLTPETKDMFGYANLLGDDISLVEVSMIANDNSTVIFELEEFSVSSRESGNVKLYAYPTEEVEYEVFVEKDFEPSIIYAVALISAVALCGLAILLLYRKSGVRKFCVTNQENLAISASMVERNVLKGWRLLRMFH